MKMIEDCRSGLIDCIRTKSVSRFGRNTVDTLIYTRELRSLGIDVFSRKRSNRQLSPTLPDSPTHDKITPTIPAKWNGLRWST